MVGLWTMTTQRDRNHCFCVVDGLYSLIKHESSIVFSQAVLMPCKDYCLYYKAKGFVA